MMLPAAQIVVNGDGGEERRRATCFDQQKRDRARLSRAVPHRGRLLVWVYGGVRLTLARALSGLQRPIAVNL